MWPLLLHVTQFLAFAESLGLALLLGLRVRGVPGIGQLILFLIGVSVWIASCEAPNWLGPAGVPIGRFLQTLSPVTSAVFLHFVLVFCHAPKPEPWLRAGYGIGTATMIAAWIIPPGGYVLGPASRISSCPMPWA